MAAQPADLERRHQRLGRIADPRSGAERLEAVGGGGEEGVAAGVGIGDSRADRAAGGVDRDQVLHRAGEGDGGDARPAERSDRRAGGVPPGVRIAAAVSAAIARLGTRPHRPASLEEHGLQGRGADVESEDGRTHAARPARRISTAAMITGVRVRNLPSPVRLSRPTFCG